MNLTILQGDVFERLAELPEDSIDLCITSPPYWGLRNYEVEGQLGAEPTMETYLTNLIKPYIKSLCPQHGTVLDPFLGSGTTMRVAMENKRNCIGIDLNEDYVAYAKKRLNWGMGLGVEYKEVTKQ